MALGFYGIFVLLFFLPRSDGSFLEPIMGVFLSLSAIVSLIAAVNGQVWWILIAGGVVLTVCNLFVRTIH